MAITARTRKVLWALSNNQCARCEANGAAAEGAEEDAAGRTALAETPEQR